MVYGSQQSNSSANGTITSPEIAALEGDQGKGGCIVVVPATGGRGAPPPAANKTSGRFPDGADTDSNCVDFLTQATTTLPAAAAIGATNIKVASVADFGPGQTIMIDAGLALEIVEIAMVGTSGATTVGTATTAGTTVIPVASTAGFAAGQTITIDSGANTETAVIAATAGGGRGGNPITITVTVPLTRAHAVGAQVSGSGITLTSALSRAHGIGTQVISGVPTPGAPNRYFRRSN
jgi:hypothetical protein